MPHILSPAERIATLRRRARIGHREFAQMVGVHYADTQKWETGKVPAAKHVIAQLDAWEAAGIEIGRPVPKITYTRGWPFDGERRKR